MPSPLRIPKHPVTVAWALFKLWHRLPPRQRQRLLRAARTHGPRIAARAAAGAAASARRRVGKGR